MLLLTEYAGLLCVPNHMYTMIMFHSPLLSECLIVANNPGMSEQSQNFEHCDPVGVHSVLEFKRTLHAYTL